jgi:hypothetical protein
MSAAPEGRAPGPAISSPELALVDPETRALDAERAHVPPSVVRPDVAGVVPEAVAPVADGNPTEPPVTDDGATEASVADRGGTAAPVADGDLTEAMRRLAELADVDPPERRSRSIRALGITFAATAWLVLAVVVADMQLWRL